MIEIFSDGCSLGNPGRAGVGVVVYRQKEIVKKISKYIGLTTNNVAEYTGLITALQEAVKNPKRQFKIYLDSELVVKQIDGRYKVRNKNLYPFYLIAKDMINNLNSCEVLYIPREKNETADRLAKQAARSGCSSG
jgi:ribonuclease HI